MVLVSAAAVIAVEALTDDAPAVSEAAAPTPEDVAAARSFVRGVRGSAGSAIGGTRPLVVNEADLNSVIRLGGRLIPGFRGRLKIGEGSVLVEASIPVHRLQDAGWLNLSATVPAFEGGLALNELTVGGVPIPPRLALETGRIGANLVVGGNFGDTVLTAARRMEIEGDALSFDLDLEQLGRNGVLRGVFGTLRGSEMPQPAQIDRYYLLIREAMDRGELPVEGSYLPYLRFTLQAALEGSRVDGPENAYTSALFALTRVCGAGGFPAVVGQLTGGSLVADRGWKTDCAQLTLNGRTDSRLHFTTAAAIQAASNRGFAVSIGEYKELYDTLKAGGFDLTDIAANNSGIRMSNRFMSAPVEDWPDLLQRLGNEDDVIVPFDDLPRIMSGEQFRSAYQDIESPAYKAMLDGIERKIDQLALHADP